MGVRRDLPSCIFACPNINILFYLLAGPTNRKKGCQTARKQLIPTRACLVFYSKLISSFSRRWFRMRLLLLAKVKVQDGYCIADEKRARRFSSRLPMKDVRYRSQSAAPHSSTVTLPKCTYWNSGPRPITSHFVTSHISSRQSNTGDKDL